MDGDGMGGRTFGMGRKLGSGDLQLLILKLLADKPRHGYEIIKALDELSQGFYVPSPGVVYPALTYLEEIGLATIEADGARKRYHLTDAGRQHIEDNRDRIADLFAQVESVAQRMGQIRRAMRTEEGDVSADAERHGRGSKELLRARCDLKAALSGKWNAPAEEQRRVIEILRRATSEIAGRAPADDPASG